MRKHSYERLSAQDQSFLVMENASLHMHVGATQIFEAGRLKTPDGGINAALYKRAIESVLHRIPRYRQRVMWTPIENQPVWVDDAAFNLDYHIRHTALPHPGGEEELKQLAARIMAQQLDRARPLWEMWVVEGLQGNRFAVINKLHHSMIDGLAGMDLAHITLSPTPDYEIHESPRFVPHTAPSGWELLRDALLRRASLPVQIARGVREFRRDAKDLRRELLLRAQAIADVIRYTAQPAPATPLNGTVGPHRRIDWLSMPLAQFKAVSKACDCTVNDVVLATVAGAVREFLMSRRVHPAEIDFRVSAPVSVRREEERGRLGNRVSSWIVELPTGEMNPLTRLEALKNATKDLKARQQALGVETMMAVAEWTPTVLLSLGMRATSGATNMIVTNVPGPRIPLHLLGAKLLEMYPVPPLLERTGLAIGLISYAGKMCWGFNADYELVPDLRTFVKMMGASFKELVKAVGLEPKRNRREAAGQEVSDWRSGMDGSRAKGPVGRRRRKPPQRGRFAPGRHALDHVRVY